MERQSSKTLAKRMLPGFLCVIAAALLTSSGELDNTKTLIAAILGLVAISNFCFSDRRSPAVYSFKSRVRSTEERWRKRYLSDARGFVLILRPFGGRKYVRLEDGGVEEFVVLLADVLNRYAGVIFVGDDDPQEFLPGVVLRPPDERWQTVVAEAARAAHRILIIPESTGSLEYEMRALLDGGVLYKVIVCVPPDPDSANVETWNATVARYRAVGFALPPHDSAGRLYVPCNNFSVPVGASGPLNLSIGWNLEHLDAAIAALWRGFLHPAQPLRECLPRLIAFEEAQPQAAEPPPLDRRLGGYTIQLLMTACEYGVRRDTRTVAVDDLRNFAGLGV